MKNTVILLANSPSSSNYHTYLACYAKSNYLLAAWGDTKDKKRKEDILLPAPRLFNLDNKM